MLDQHVTADLDERRTAVAELGDALRALTTNAIGSEVDVGVLRRVADREFGLCVISKSGTTLEPASKASYYNPCSSRCEGTPVSAGTGSRR